MPMRGWRVPPPREPIKSEADFAGERAAKVASLVREGMIRSDRIRRALLRVPRERFIPRLYRDYAYWEVPLPLPGELSTISCPHSYPLFYEPLGLDRGHRFLEIGLGSGYGSAVAREVVGREGLVVSVEIDPVTFAFGEENLKRAGYRDIVLVNGDGWVGVPALAPYDRIALTVSVSEIPPPLLEQLRGGGRLIAPLITTDDIQVLTVVEKSGEDFKTEQVCEVLYMRMR